MFISFNPSASNTYQSQSNSYFYGYGGGTSQNNTAPMAAQTVADDGGVTTQAIGEEGGGEGNIQTSEVLAILDYADQGPAFNPQGDGQLSQQELSQFSNLLSRQVTVLKSFDQYFPWMGLGTVISDMERKLEVAQFMGTHFNNIADADGQAQTMTADDVTTTAANDGNADDISLTDVAVDGGPGGGDAPQRTLDLMRLQQQWDTDRNRQLSRPEVDNAAMYLADELERLKQIQTLVFDPQLAARIQQVENDLNGMKLMQNNFDPLAVADSSLGGIANQISIFDLLITAARDGNIFELDPAEIPPVEPPMQFTTLALGEEGGGI